MSSALVSDDTSTAEAGMAPVVDDLSVFLLGGRVRSARMAITEAQDAEQLGFNQVWLCERFEVKEAGASRALPSITTEQVERLMDKLTEERRSPRTVQAARNALGRLLRVAKADGLVSTVATEHASRIRRTATIDDPTTKALEPADIVKLFEAAAGTHWEALIAALAFLGLRRGEALGLCWGDVDFGSGVITVRHSLARLKKDGGSWSRTPSPPCTWPSATSWPA